MEIASTGAPWSLWVMAIDAWLFIIIYAPRSIGSKVENRARTGVRSLVTAARSQRKARPVWLSPSPGVVSFICNVF